MSAHIISKQVKVHMLGSAEGQTAAAAAETINNNDKESRKFMGGET